MSHLEAILVLDYLNHLLHFYFLADHPFSVSATLRFFCPLFLQRCDCRRQKLKVEKEEILPGKSYSIQTHTTNKDMIIARLEQELSTIQGKKTKAIETLSKFRIEKAKLENESVGNEVVDDWIAAVLEEDEEDSDE